MRMNICPEVAREGANAFPFKRIKENAENKK
jgi:hypothetical protein